MPPESSPGILSVASVRPTACNFFSDDAFNFRRRFQPVFDEIKPHVFTDRERIEQRPGLEHERRAIFGRDFSRFNGFTVDQNFAGIRSFKADQVLEQDAFATAARVP